MDYLPHRKESSYTVSISLSISELKASTQRSFCLIGVRVTRKIRADHSSWLPGIASELSGSNAMRPSRILEG